MSIITERKSIRSYKRDHYIPRNTLNQLLKDAYRAPSSMNLQPVRLIVVESNDARERLRPILFGNDLQLETASALILIFVDRNKFQYAPHIFDQAVKKNIMPAEIRDKQLANISQLASTISKEKLDRTNDIDGGLFAMNLMLSAKTYGYDTCPIGGFDYNKLAEAFKLDPNRYRPLLIVSLGLANESGYESIRLDLEDITTYL